MHFRGAEKTGFSKAGGGENPELSRQQGLFCGNLEVCSGKRALYSIQKSLVFNPEEPSFLSKRAQCSIQKSPVFYPKEPCMPSTRALREVNPLTYRGNKALR